MSRSPRFKLFFFATVGLVLLSTCRHLFAFRGHIGGSARRPLRSNQGVPRVVWAFWFGNQMRRARLEAFHSLSRNVGAQVNLVTTQNLTQYEQQDYPFHPAMKFLSSVHKSDYLRAYFMHFYGGGYHDIKSHRSEDSWEHDFSELELNTAVWLKGSAEVKREDVACDEAYARIILNGILPGCSFGQDVRLDNIEANHGSCCEHIFKSWDKLVQNGAYLMRPRNAFTKDWLDNLHARLDAKYTLLKLNPAPFPRCCPKGANTQGYPIRWAELHGEIFHVLQVKHLAHVSQGLKRWHMGVRYRDDSENSIFWNEPVENRQRVLVGIFTTAAEVLRQRNWRALLKSRMVNDASTDHAAALRPGLNFVFIEGLNFPLKPKEPDKMILDMPENMNSGKSVAWFRTAFHRYQDADFIVKMDSDTHICPGRIQTAFSHAAQDGAIYVGRIATRCGGGHHCPKTWQYMSGGFHGLSRAAVATMLLKQEGRPTVLHQHEDINTGYWMQVVNRDVGANYTFELDDETVRWQGGDEASLRFLCEGNSYL